MHLLMQSPNTNIKTAFSLPPAFISLLSYIAGDDCECTTQQSSALAVRLFLHREKIMPCISNMFPLSPFPGMIFCFYSIQIPKFNPKLSNFDGRLEAAYGLHLSRNILATSSSRKHMKLFHPHRGRKQHSSTHPSTQNWPAIKGLASVLETEWSPDEQTSFGERGSLIGPGADHLRNHRELLPCLSGWRRLKSTHVISYFFCLPSICLITCVAHSSLYVLGYWEKNFTYYNSNTSTLYP